MLLQVKCAILHWLSHCFLITLQSAGESTYDLLTYQSVHTNLVGYFNMEKSHTSPLKV